MSENEAAAGAASAAPVKATFAHVGRYSSWSFLALDLVGSAIFHALLLTHVPSLKPIKVGLTIGVVGVLADGGYWYGIKKTRKVELETPDGGWAEVPRYDPRYIGLWLMFWVDLVIGTNIGTYIGLMFEQNLDFASAWTVGFLVWFYAVGLLARLLRRPGDVRIRATRLMSTGTRLTSLILPSIVYAILYMLEMLTLGQIGAMFLIGCLASFAMELPLYTLGWRHPKGHWAAPVANTLCEWNSVVPLLYLLFRAVS